MCIGAPDRRKFFCDKEFSLVRRTSPMPTECSPTLFEFAPLEGRKVVAGFDGGAITSDAGGLLLGATDKVLGLTRRLAACFQDHRDPDLIEHRVETLLTQRITAIALGYEDLNDHDQLRYDPLMAVLAGKLAASRSDCAPVAGKIGSQRACALGSRHAQPPGTEPSRTDALREDCCRRCSHRKPVHRCLPRRPHRAARGDHPRPRCHRRSAAR
jgi:hypothetical protein